MAKTVMITGASSGIGRAAAEKFAAEGWNVVATMRKPEPWEHPNIVSTALDVTNKDSIREAVAFAIERFGSIDVLVNNAGYGTFGPLESFTDEQIELQFATNVTGLLAVTRAVLPGMRERGSGTIVNISSAGGVLTLPMYSLYHGTKWAVEGITESLTFELAPLGIRVKLIEPSAIDTEFSGRSFVTADLPIAPEYQPVYDAVLGGVSQDRSPATVVSDVIFEAATDETETLRYPAGADAVGYIAFRHAQGDMASVAAVRARYGI